MILSPFEHPYFRFFLIFLFLPCEIENMLYGDTSAYVHFGKVQLGNLYVLFGRENYLLGIQPLFGTQLARNCMGQK